MTNDAKPAQGGQGARPADEIIEEIAKWLDDCAAILRKKQASQLRIDPEWTVVELQAEAVDQLVDGMNTAAANLRHATKRDTP
jgi:hypothetical protein